MKKEDIIKYSVLLPTYNKVNYLKYTKINDGDEFLVKIRYKHKGEYATLYNYEGRIRVLFHKKVRGIAPGQSAAIYEGNDLIAGGFIMK